MPARLGYGFLCDLFIDAGYDGGPAGTCDGRKGSAPDIGAQTSPHSLFIRYRISAQAEGIILASRLLLLPMVSDLAVNRTGA
jgi:hypothetical protein